VLTADSERRPARREELESRTRTQQLGNRRSRVEHLFAIIEQEEQLLWSKLGVERLERGSVSRWMNPKDLGNRRYNQSWVANRRKVNEASTIGK
jgi:hypothetical protein